MSHPEVRLEPLRPAEADLALARANVAWVPLGALEYHAPHLPMRGFVDRYWPEPFRLRAASGALTLTNPGAVSRCLSSLDLRLDGQPIAPDAILLLNPSPGESPVPMAADSLRPETGFYVRRRQTAELRLIDSLVRGRTASSCESVSPA